MRSSLIITLLLGLNGLDGGCAPIEGAQPMRSSRTNGPDTASRGQYAAEHDPSCDPAPSDPLPAIADPSTGPGSAFSLGLTPRYDSCYGSGDYGKWVTGALGLPAYKYDHARAAGRTYSAQPPYHMLGNSGSLAHSYADGYHVLFSTRSFPRFANYFRPSRSAFAGGFGYVYDDATREIWSTHRPTAPADASFTTTWGMGYSRKEVSHSGIEIVEDTFAPVGDDEVLLQKIVITNRGPAAKDLSYYSYWDWDPYIVKQYVPSIFSGSYYESESYELARDLENSALTAKIKGDPFVISAKPTKPDFLLDPVARTGFFALLNTNIDAYEMQQAAVFPVGSTTPGLRGKPVLRAFTQQPKTATATTDKAMFFAEKRLSLGAGQSATLYTLYGMARRDDAAVAELIKRYRRTYASQFEQVVRDFERKSVRFTVPDTSDDWLSREVAWDSYYLNAGVMLEDAFGEHAVNQNSVYMAGQGQNMAPRDIVQYAMPLIYSNPQIAKESLRYVLRLMTPNGQLPFGSSAFGWKTAGDSVLRPSDLGFWLQWGVAEYVNATRDYAFLDERLPYYSDQRISSAAAPTTSVMDMLAKSVDYQFDTIGAGKHGLVRILKSDWADFLTAQSGDEAQTFEKGESINTTALLLVAYPKLAELADRAGRIALRDRIREVLEPAAFPGAMKAQFLTLPSSEPGKLRGFFKRAYMYGAGPNNDAPYEFGADHWWAESNAFALLAEPRLLDQNQLEQMYTAITDPHLGAVTPIGVNITSFVAPGYDYPGTAAPGNTTWYSLSGALVVGLASYAELSENAKRLAWDEFKRATLANHAELYPEMFYGIISGSDAWETNLNETFSAREGPGGVAVEGSSWLEDFGNRSPSGGDPFTKPGDEEHSINNMHSHSHLIHNALRLAGVRATRAGYEIRPAMPTDAGFGWESQTFGVRYETRRITGKIVARGDDAVSMRVKLTDELAAADRQIVTVDGAVVSARREGSSLVFPLKLTKNVETRWSIEG